MVDWVAEEVGAWWLGRWLVVVIDRHCVCVFCDGGDVDLILVRVINIGDVDLERNR